ncbi:MAG TPA: cbb3-type cytochrome c oxidase subunit I [Thermoanaerobaculia bacterium]|nr:cbb3-type cytochrome c oxidase subunit I [Thermoanaerobaculia bacterium]
MSTPMPSPLPFREPEVAPPPPEHIPGVHPAPTSFWRKYIFSLDHKVIGKQYLLYALAMLVVGGLLAILVRWQLAWPGKPIAFMGKLFPEGMPNGQMLPEFYNSLFTMHATIMIFFAIMPILIGAFGNFVVPIQIGARDMAFPTLNMLSFWTAVPAAVIIIWSFFVTGGAAQSGWTSYAPLAVVQPRGQTLWLLSLLILGLSSLLTSVNFITTIINMRAPGMTFFRLPLTVWALFITAILLLLALPVLSGALIMMLFDRVLGTTFFLPAGMIVSGQAWPNAGGGQALLWQHLFWFFGHPEVYIMILPAMGITSEILPVFARKPIFGYRAMAYSIMGIAGLGFIVWGHHMFQSGMNPTLGTTFMISTMVIAVPSAIKTFNWLGTLWGGNIHFTTPMLNAITFVAMFVIGGLSGIFMASTPVDIFIHDTYFIVGHIHYVLFGGSLFGAFAGLYYWYPKMFGRLMSERWGKIHWFLTFVTFNLVFFPMHFLGMRGMQRRIYDYSQYAHLKGLQPMNQMMTISLFVLGAAQIILVFNFFLSMRRGKIAGPNPWRANTLEWQTSSPPPHENFIGAELPTVYRGPYEYSAPERADDHWPQNEPPGAGSTAGAHA